MCVCRVAVKQHLIDRSIDRERDDHMFMDQIEVVGKSISYDMSYSNTVNLKFIFRFIR